MYANTIILIWKLGGFEKFNINLVSMWGLY